MDSHSSREIGLAEWALELALAAGAVIFDGEAENGARRVWVSSDLVDADRARRA